MASPCHIAGLVLDLGFIQPNFCTTFICIILSWSLYVNFKLAGPPLIPIAITLGNTSCLTCFACLNPQLFLLLVLVLIHMTYLSTLHYTGMVLMLQFVDLSQFKWVRGFDLNWLRETAFYIFPVFL